MSALSKTFVAILVVLSLLLSSAVIVWVNKTDDYRGSLAAAEQRIAQETKGRVDANAEAAAAKEAHQAAITTFNQQIENVQAELRSREGEISKREVQIADLSAQAKQQLISLTSTGEALKASEAQKRVQSEQLAEMRKSFDQLVRERAELNTALADATNRLEVMTREWRFMREQLTEAQASTDRLSGQVKDLGGTPGQGPAGVRAGAPPINGVVREVRQLDDNRTWATISVGTADAVQQGMEFKVIDAKSGTFLGVLTVQNVQPNESVGVLAGPRVNEVKPGTEVRTQL